MSDIANVNNPRTLVSAGSFFQPLFSDFDNASSPPVISPELRAPSATYSQAVVPQNSIPSHENNTNAVNTFSRDGMTAVHIMIAGQMNAATGNNKDVAFRVIRWYAVRIPRLDSQGNQAPDVYVPVASEYTAQLGNNLNGSLSGTKKTMTTFTCLADTLAATSSPGAQDEIIFSPANDNVALLTLDMHGCSAITIDVKQGAAAPDKVQVFIGAE